MNRRNKIITLSSIFLLFICAIFYWINFSHNCVKKAINRNYAYFIQDGETYFIIGKYEKYDGGGTEIFYYLRGTEKVPVRIMGNNPYDEIDSRLLKGNQFLIKGGIDRDMSLFLNIDVLNAETWEIIAPIKRNMVVMKRGLASIWYLDEKDIECGAYTPNDTNLRGVSYWEEKWLRHIWKDNYIIVLPDYEKERIQWYLLSNGKKSQYFLKETVLKSIVENNMKKRK